MHVQMDRDANICRHASWCVVECGGRFFAIHVNVTNVVTIYIVLTYTTMI